jgi:hypothetical protein
MFFMFQSRLQNSINSLIKNIVNGPNRHHRREYQQELREVQSPGECLVPRARGLDFRAVAAPNACPLGGRRGRIKNMIEAAS